MPDLGGGGYIRAGAIFERGLYSGCYSIKKIPDVLKKGSGTHHKIGENVLFLLNWVLLGRGAIYRGLSNGGYSNLFNFLRMEGAI